MHDPVDKGAFVPSLNADAPPVFAQAAAVLLGTVIVVLPATVVQPGEVVVAVPAAQVHLRAWLGYGRDTRWRGPLTGIATLHSLLTFQSPALHTIPWPRTTNTHLAAVTVGETATAVIAASSSFVAHCNVAAASVSA